MEKIEVILRKNKRGGEIEAFFPYEIADMDGNITCVSLKEGHSAASFEYIRKDTVPVKEGEYESFKKELEDLYNEYELKVIKRMQHDKYIKAYWAVRTK